MTTRDEHEESGSQLLQTQVLPNRETDSWHTRLAAQNKRLSPSNPHNECIMMSLCFVISCSFALTGSLTDSHRSLDSQQSSIRQA